MANKARPGRNPGGDADMVNTVTALRQVGQSPTAEALKSLGERIAGCTLSTSVGNHRRFGFHRAAELLLEKRTGNVIQAGFGYVMQTIRLPHSWTCS